MTGTRKLTAQEANRLAVQMQILRINLIEFALKYTLKGKSFLWGTEVDKHTLTREKVKLQELYRVKTIHETTIRDLPYLAGNGSRVDKIKEHYLAEDGTIGFVEVKENSHGPSVVNHLLSKRTIKKRIKKKQSSSNKKSKKMSTKKRVATPQDEDLLGFDTDVSDILDGIDKEILVHKAGDKVTFVHNAILKKGSVIKSGLQEGKVKVADTGGTVYLVKPDDITINNETAAQHLARKGGKRPVYQQTEIPLKETKADKQAKLKTPTKKAGGKTQKELVETLAEKGERDYDKIAEKTGVTRTNVGQYMYRWLKANPKKA